MARGEHTRNVEAAILKPNGRSDKEIAAELGTTVDYIWTVRQRLRRRTKAVPRRPDKRMIGLPAEAGAVEALETAAPDEVEEIRGVRLVKVELTNQPPPPPQEAEREVHECGACGAKVEADAAECTACGAVFDE